MLSPEDMDGDSIGPLEALLAYSSTEPSGTEEGAPLDPALRTRLCRRP